MARTHPGVDRRKMNNNQVKKEARDIRSSREYRAQTGGKKKIINTVFLDVRWTTRHGDDKMTPPTYLCGDPLSVCLASEANTWPSEGDAKQKRSQGKEQEHH